jgi:hypothetical protein
VTFDPVMLQTLAITTSKVRKLASVPQSVKRFFDEMAELNVRRAGGSNKLHANPFFLNEPDQ